MQHMPSRRESVCCVRLLACFPNCLHRASGCWSLAVVTAYRAFCACWQEQLYISRCVHCYRSLLFTRTVSHQDALAARAHEPKAPLWQALFLQSLSTNYCTVLCCTELYCTVLYCTVLCCDVLYCTVLYCALSAYAPFPRQQQSMLQHHKDMTMPPHISAGLWSIVTTRARLGSC
jgi:hypothetical protein